MPERPKVIRETDSEALRLGKTLLRTARFGALASLDPASGAPLASRVAVATDLDGTPLILISALSDHTRALSADPRSSLLLGEPGTGDPLAYPRISLRCLAHRPEPGGQDDARMRRRYLNKHPEARLYAGFADFSVVALGIVGASLNGGFARAYRLVREDLLSDKTVSTALAGFEQEAIDHMNADHGDAVTACARAFAGAREDGWLVSGIDPEGVDIVRAHDCRRIFFEPPLVTAGNLRDALIRLVSKARSGSSGPGGINR